MAAGMNNGRRNGGTEAPPRRGRGRGNPPPRVAPGTPPGLGGVRPGAGMPGNPPAARKAGVGGAALPGPGGRQLAARVQSGAITQAQAQQTMQQRQTLQKAFGSNWRDKLNQGGKSFAQVNAGLKKNPGNAKLAALRKKLLEGRKSALEQARQKVGGGNSETGSGE
jgi:hypothetical protein